MGKTIDACGVSYAASFLRRLVFTVFILPIAFAAYAQDTITRPLGPNPGITQPTLRYSYAARTSRSIVKILPAGSLTWQCHEHTCTSNGLMALGIEACQSLARAAGTILAFSRNGMAYSASQLALCNQQTQTASPAPPRACTDDSQCDDTLFCNGREVCGLSNTCQTVLPLPCGDDGVACTFDGCDEAIRQCTPVGPDQDSDGHADANCVQADGSPSGDDCDDLNPNRFTGNRETCDTIDQDCDPTTIGVQDYDLDGYISSACSNGPNAGDDCDDNRAGVHPGASELCDDIDNNCVDGTHDEPTVTVWPDGDKDGFGANSGAQNICLIGDVLTRAPFKSLNNFDCNDSDPRAHDSHLTPSASCRPP